MPRECAGMRVQGRTRRGAEQQGAAGLAAPLAVLPRPGTYGCAGNGARPGWPDRRCIHSASRDPARGATPTQPASSSIRRRGPCCCVASRRWRQTRVRGQPRSPGPTRPVGTWYGTGQHTAPAGPPSRSRPCCSCGPQEQQGLLYRTMVQGNTRRDTLGSRAQKRAPASLMPYGLSEVVLMITRSGSESVDQLEAVRLRVWHCAGCGLSHSAPVPVLWRRGHWHHDCSRGAGALGLTPGSREGRSLALTDTGNSQSA